MSDETTTPAKAAPKAAAKTSGYTPPAIFTSLAKVLASMSVEKGGTLPSNMGGKPYITATDLNTEAKRQFVDNDIAFIPTEEFVKHESIINKDRINVVVVIAGHYRLVSLIDGSEATISGIGDGLAGGTAVASNIASTNALKNALLRAFLVTEQSVEDKAKDGPGEETGPTRAQQNITAAAAATPAATGVSDAIAGLQQDIKNAATGRAEKEPGFKYMQFASNLLGSESQGWSKDEAKLRKVLAAIIAGEAA